MNKVYLGFDFGYRRIGVAVGQAITRTATPLPTMLANLGVPDWQVVTKLLQDWRPCALVVGLPTRINDSEFYTTKAAQEFAQSLQDKFNLPVHLVDERFSTIEARTQLFASGGSRKIRKTAVDSIAACIILEQWLTQV
jgi:putative holliday junction resolvase